MGGRQGWRRVSMAAAVASTAAVAACSGSSSSTPPVTTVAEVPETPPVTVTSDGVLRIGLLLPASGDASDFGRPLIAGAELAGREINAAGGVDGSNVIIVRADEGADGAETATGLEQLLAENVDVIVGPASSHTALAVMRRATERTVVCSPTASAIALSEFPDQGRFFRTIPSDALAARALADLIISSGRRTVGVLTPDDDFGERFAGVLTTALAAANVEIRASATFNPTDDDLGPVARQVLSDGPDVLAVIGDEQSGGRMLAAVGAEDRRGVPVYVNDALRRSPGLAAARSAAPGFLQRVLGVSPQSAPPDNEQFARTLNVGATSRSIDFAAYAYDCVTAVALAAATAGTDTPDALAAALVEISRQGSPCTTYKACLDASKQSFNIDYNGMSGLLEFDSSGDVGSGTFSMFGFDPAGLDVSVGTIVARR